MTAPNQQAETHSVEISGWDTDENFFVERAYLQNYADGHKHVSIRSRLRIGSLVFLRISDELSPERSVPVAYEVSKMSEPASNRLADVELVRRHPREHLYRLHAEDFVAAPRLN
jgi:hypothetical protein